MIFFCCSFLFAQQNEIAEKTSELNGIRSEIRSLERELNDKISQEKVTLSSLENLNKQSHLINKLIVELKKEESRLNRKITVTRTGIKSKENKIVEIKDAYSKYIVWLYKNGNVSKIKYLVDAESINQAVRRFGYLKYITQKNEEVVGKLEIEKKELAVLENSLRNDLTSKRKIISEKEKEQASLEKKKLEKNRIIAGLKKDVKNLNTEIDERKKAQEKIKQIIAGLEEELKNQENTSPNEVNYAKFDYTGFTNFSELKGKLGWPVKSGKVIRNFGQNKNTRLNTVTINYGIDIKTSANTDVFAVADGYVSAIDWIPGYGSVVILTHKSGFRTVYGHLSDILVSEGDKVSGGSLLGTVSESLEGYVIHFEIWQKRNNQNPSTWLVRK